MFIVHFLIFNFHDFGKVTFFKTFIVKIFGMSGSLPQKQMLRACSSYIIQREFKRIKNQNKMAINLISNSTHMCTIIHNFISNSKISNQ